MSCDSASEHCSRFNNDADDADDAILPTLAAWLLDCCDSGPNIKNDFARGCHSELKLQSWRIIATHRSPKECPLSYMLTSATRTAHCGHPPLGSLALHHMHRGYRKKKGSQKDTMLPMLPMLPMPYQSATPTLGTMGAGSAAHQAC